MVDPRAIEARVRELIDLVGLDTSHLEQLPAGLSGGQRQRVGIARAVATGPAFVIADEPVTSLDVSVQAQILNLLHDLQERLGLSYLFISHDLAVVEHMADQIAVMADGRIVEIAKTSTLLAEPQHPETQRLVEIARRSH